MTPKEKSYIIGILTQARCEQQSLILSLHAMDISDQAADDLEKIYTKHINAIDKTIALLDKEGDINGL